MIRGAKISEYPFYIFSTRKITIQSPQACINKSFEGLNFINKTQAFWCSKFQFEEQSKELHFPLEWTR
ncbi:hypothetical protein AAC387_Pa09g1482 [Persea americana]